MSGIRVLNLTVVGIDMAIESKNVFQVAHDSVNSARDIQAAVEALKTLYDADFVYHLAQIPDKGLDAPFVKGTYPPAWFGHYMLEGYINIDPVVLAGFSRKLPFQWSELEMTEDAIKMMIDSVKYGLGGSGYSIPVTDKQGRNALFSVNSRLTGKHWTYYLKKYRGDFIELAHLVHKQAVGEIFGEYKNVTLSPREIEVLQWSAFGKEAPMIATITGLKVHTVRAYAKSARNKLNASTISHAITKAVKMRIINLTHDELDKNMD